MNPVRYSHDILSTSMGLIAIIASNRGLVELLIGSDGSNLVQLIQGKYPSSALVQDGLVAAASSQLSEYFHGERRYFELALDSSVRSAFAQAIFDRLIQVPYGETMTYGGLAACAGYPGRARAVGQVMATNPLPIILPCHRIIGSSGALTGYSAGDGINTKRWLLEFEKATLKN